MPSQLFTIVPDERYIVLQLQVLSMDVEACDAMHALLDEQIEQKCRPVILDLSRARFLPSLALGALVDSKKKMDAHGTRLVLVGLSPNIRKAMATASLDHVFAMADTLQDAAVTQASAK